MTAPAKAVEEVGRTALEVREEMEADIRRWCADHVAQIGDAAASIVFRNPGTTVYLMTFRIQGRYLIVTGDVGEAIYEWSSPIGWAFLADCDFGYFESKLQAHPKGRRARGWDSMVAMNAVATSGAIPEETLEKHDHYVPAALKEMTGQAEDWYDEPSMATREDWHEWLRDFADDAFGDAWWEWAPSAGDIPDSWVLAHWVGLKLALEQVGERAIEESRP